MDDTSEMRVAHVSCAADGTHLKLQLRLHDDRKTFYRLKDEKLERVRYRLQLVASSAAGKGVQTGKKLKKKRKNGAPMPSVSVKFMDAEGQEIDDKAATVGDALTRTKSLQVGAERFVVLLNQPIVTHLTVLEPVMTGIPVIPMPETEFCTADECAWRWFRLRQEEKTLVSKQRRYTPSEEDVGCLFYVECHAPAMRSEFAEDSKAEVGTSPVQRGPKREVFNERRRLGATSASEKYPDAAEAFRVMSYNVLYDGYATTEHAQKNLFPYVDASVIKETRRIQLIFQEIEENNCDIVCLQEMGEHVYKKFFDPMLSSIGYHGFYCGKTGTTNEGCAVFVRMERFEVVAEDTINLATAVKDSANPAVQSLLQDYPEIAKGINRSPSVAQVLVLRSKSDPARSIILSNTHLFYRGDAHLIRLLQGAALVDNVSQRKAESGLEHSAVVMCGDWNAHPRAPLVAFLLDGQIDSNHKHWQLAPSFRWNLSRADEKSPEGKNEAALQVRPNRLEHALRLVSACGIPPFTNYVTTFVDTLDYILVGSEVLQVRDVFPFFTEEEVTHEVALPSSTFPSDHISLVCDLTW